MPKLTAAQWALLSGVGFSMVLSGAFAVYPPNTLLQLGPVLLAILLGPWLLRRFPISITALACIVAFLLLHNLAACWTYSDVPYDNWGRKLLGLSIDAALGFKRNQFDRLVHFSFGLLAIRPVIEIAQRYFGLGRRAALYAAISFVIAFGALYEIFEWLLAVFMDPASAEAYNGQQGDAFDSQKDMAIAAVGGAIGMLLADRYPAAENRS